VNEEELKERLENIRKNARWIDEIVHADYETGEGKLTKTQVPIVRDMLKLLRELEFQLALNSYKEIKYSEKDVIDTGECGTPVKVRSCKEEHGDKTRFGILIGDVALGISHSISKDGIITASSCHHNPAIFVPELNEIIYGCSSWWGRIESEEELNDIIDDELINNVWYVKALKKLGK